jgi:hypothetical protein
LNLIDVNLLLYAYNPSFPRHDRAKRWWEDQLSGPEPVHLAGVSIVASIRIGTNPRAFEKPLTGPVAVAIVASWLEAPVVRILGPGERHWEVLSRLIVETPLHGPIVSDGHLAALAIEHGLTLCTSDRDFRSFPGLRAWNPLEDEG